MRFCSKRTSELLVYIYIIHWERFLLEFDFLLLNFGHVGYSIPYMLLISLALKAFYLTLAACCFSALYGPLA